MKIFKKTVMVTLALLPIMSFLLFAVTNLGNTSGQPFKQFGTYYIQGNSLEGHNLYAEQNTIISELVHTLTNGEFYYDNREGNNGLIYEFYRVPPNTVIDAFLTLAYELQGFGFSPPCLIAFFYTFYIVFVELIMMLYEIILFIPKKCREIFGG